MPDAAAGLKKPWYCSIRWITAGAVLLVLCAVLWGLFRPEPPITIGPRTTVILAPLASDGLPDYGQYVLDQIGRGTPPEENAAVLLMQAMWPMGVEAADLLDVCRELGIPATAPKEPPLVDPSENADERAVIAAWLAAKWAEGGQAGGAVAEDGIDVLDVDSLLDAAQDTAWKGVDVPPLAGWVQRNVHALDQFVAASRRPLYYFPWSELVSSRHERFPLYPGFLTNRVALDLVRRSLGWRGMWHLGEGRVGDAWQDILAMRRFARLAAPQGPQFRSAFDLLLAVSMEEYANRATLELLDHPGLVSGQLAAIRRDLESLSPLGEAWRAFTLDRLIICNHMVSIAQARRRGDHSPPVGLILIDAIKFTSIDWNIVLEWINDTYDRVDAVFRLRTWADRQTQARRLEAELKDAEELSVTYVGMIDRVLRFGLSRPARSRFWAVSHVAPMWSFFDRSFTAGEAGRRIVHLAAALAAWRLDRGGGEGHPYPERLEDLVPAYLADIPLDPFTERPFIYARRDGGYLLYSVGENGVDDGGTDRDGWVVRMPLPERSVLPSPASRR